MKNSEMSINLDNISKKANKLFKEMKYIENKQNLINELETRNFLVKVNKNSLKIEYKFEEGVTHPFGKATLYDGEDFEDINYYIDNYRDIYLTENI